MPETIIEFGDHQHIPILFGPQDRNLRKIRSQLGIDIVLRNEQLRLRGDQESVERGEALIGSLLEIITRRGVLKETDLDRILNGYSVPEQFPDISPPVTYSPSHEEADPSPEKRAPAGPGIDLFEKGRKVHPRTPGQQQYVQTIDNNDLVFCVGPAGCGKTYLAVAMAIHALRREQIKKIVLVRPAVEAGEKLGFLPGDLLAKVNPFLRPLLDALNDMLDYEQVKRYMENDIVEIVPLAFMRGRTLNSTFMILDEAQNTTVTQMKMFLTRMGTGSKIVVTGDTTQIDLPNDIPCGLTDAMGRLSSIRGVGMVRLTGQDIVRHRLVREIVRAYDWEDA